MLEQLSGRIFLPHQAAREYLDHRLNAISARTAIYDNIKKESEKFERILENTIGEHALPNKHEILEAAKGAARRITELVEGAANDDPNLFRLDSLRDKLAAVFDGKVGPVFSRERQGEIRREAADRFARRTPPGYKDAKKDDPQKFGDVFIWFQILEQAKITKKPLIFVTRDSKEDWWLSHEGETIGPRPELGARKCYGIPAGVRFYMYTVPQFLNYVAKILEIEP